MKKSIIKTAFILLAAGFTFKGDAKAASIVVPPQVIAAFNIAYPQAQIKNWKVAKFGYKAEFKQKHKTYSVVYSADGVLVRTEAALSRVQNLPPVVQNTIKSGKFASFYVDQIKEITTQAGTVYKIILDNHLGSKMGGDDYGSWEDYQLVYNSNGILESAVAL